MSISLPKSSNLRVQAAGSGKLAALALLLGLGSSGCELDMINFVDGLLEDPCQAVGGCGDQGSSSTGIDLSTAGGAPNQSGAVSHGTAASTHPDGSGNAHTTSDQGTLNDSTGPADTSTGCTDEAPTQPAECEDGATQERTCSYCGTQAQVCKDGQWKDVGECTDQAPNYPGEIIFDPRFAKFDCGVYMSSWTYNEQCRPIDSDLPTIYVSYCQPTECCGYGSTTPPSCLDPKDLPGDASCSNGPPSPSEIGKTWMTEEMWEKFYESTKKGAPSK